MTSVSPRPDAPLLARLKQGEPAAFDAVYDQWRPRLFNFLSRQCRDRTLAEDLVQETFLRLASHRERLRDDTDLGAWLFTAARNLAVSHGRWQRLTGTLLSALGLEKEKSAHQGDHAFEQVALQQSVSRLELALASLPPDYREVLLLVGVEGLEPIVAAGVIGVKPEALRKRLSRARTMLAAALQPSGRSSGELVTGGEKP